MNFSPVPWRTNESDNVLDAGRRTIAVAFGNQRRINAQLWARAPELLELVRAANFKDPKTKEKAQKLIEEFTHDGRGIVPEALGSVLGPTAPPRRTSRP